MCVINHSDLKADPARLEAETVEAGIQEDGDGTPLFEYRTCLNCGSTITIAIGDDDDDE